MTILDEIADYTRQRMAAEEAQVPTEALAERARALAAAERAACGEFCFPFAAALAKPGLSFICEAKKASPSKGLIAPEFPYVDIARSYEEAGASAISCLTEPKWFMGSDAYLREIVEAVAIPVLRKDFVVCERMIYQAKVLGASAVLLICAILSDEQLRAYGALAAELGLSALVEAHDEGEIERAVAAGAQIIGVNNRNLKDFSVDLGNARRLRAAVPEGVLYVAESGVKTADDVASMAALGADAALIGEALMRADDKVAKLAEFRAAAQAALTAAEAASLCHPERATEGSESKDPETGGALSRGDVSTALADARSAQHDENTPSRYPERSAEDVPSCHPERATEGSESKDLPAVKFCGVSNVEDARAVNALKAHPAYVGFVFWDKSKRRVSEEEARAIRSTLDLGITTVGVFVDEQPEVVAHLLETGIIQVAQLHGHEDEAYLVHLRQLVPHSEIWKAFLLRSQADVDAANTSSADTVLVDGGLGEGNAFDWNLLEGVSRPYVLAGGLSCDNVAEAVRRLHPAAVDVSSGIECAERATDGRTRKDPAKMREFMKQVTLASQDAI